MLFVIIFGAITFLGIAISVVSTNLGNRLFYKKYKLYDKMAEKYSWMYHPGPLTDDDVKESKNIVKQKEKYYKLSDIFDYIFSISSVVYTTAGIILVILTIAVALNNIPYEIKIDNNKQIQNYQKLIFELENSEIRDDFNIRTKDLIDDVTEWNKDYDTYVYRHNSLWTNWFYPGGTIHGVDRINLEDYI